MAGEGRSKRSTANYTPHWTTRAFDTAKLFSIQLFTVGGSGAIAKTAVAPLERVKIIMQVHPMTTTHQYKGGWDALVCIGRREGLRAYFRGNGTNVARLFPEVVLRFTLYDQIKLMHSPPAGTSPGLQDRLAVSAATGLLRTGVIYPLELARTRITADTSSISQTRVYTGMADCLAKTYKLEGVRGLYKGFLLSSLGVVPYLTISFAAYDELKDQLPDSKEFKASIWHPLSKMGVGAGAAVLAQTITYPIDTVRRRIQMSGVQGTHVRYSSYWNCITQMAEREGLASFYRGSLINAIKTVPGAAVQFMAYDLIKTSVFVMENSTGGLWQD